MILRYEISIVETRSTKMDSILQAVLKIDPLEAARPEIYKVLAGMAMVLLVGFVNLCRNGRFCA